MTEGASKVKTSNSTVTIRVPSRTYTEVLKADLAKLGTPEQRKTPLEEFIQPDDTKVNATVAMVKIMQEHV